VFLSLQELQLRTIPFRVDIPAGQIDFDPAIFQNSVLHAEGSARTLNRSLGEIRVVGRLDVSVSGTCDRCLGSAVFSIDRNFDLVYVPSGESANSGAREIDAAATEVGYYEGSGLELNDVLREVVLLALPMRLVCNEACKGICPRCGQDRNVQECDCHLQAADERWSKLQDFRQALGRVR
jgi:uncharacterized protein